MKRILSLTLMIFLVTTNAWAQEEQEPESSGDSLGLNIDVGVSSAYVWRGLNLLQKEKQMDQHMFVAPSVTWSLGEGFSAGYWGAFQIIGDNRTEKIDSAVGAEQDLFISYEHTLLENLVLSASLVYYFYPFADKNIVEKGIPSYLEPIVGLTFSTVVDISLNVSYFHGIQEELKGTRHVYINPSVGKSLKISSKVGLDTSLGFGFKQFIDNESEDNIYDLLVNVSVPISVLGSWTLTPAVNFSWTNLEDIAAGTGIGAIERGFGDEYVIWGSVNISTDI